ncbi:MAG TPA: type II toxin-antitoxin system HicB family antitoxin [Verrucomicrobiae bacterium]|nr:type II toxin-antitoxin system HicB family antitoxin [Verrucomicrobiae bacterium]
MKYRVVLIQSEEGFAVSCPSLPGCWSQGRSEAEALENIRAAIRDYVEVREELNLAEYTESGARTYVREIELPVA